MGTIPQFHKHIFPGTNIALSRYYIISPDELGKVEFWKQALDQLYNRMPFPSFWQNLDLRVIHMDHPILSERERGEVSLVDFDPGTPGCQVASGLYYGNHRLDLGVFPDGWSVNQQLYKMPTAQNLDSARKTLSHESGHMYAEMCGFPNGTNNAQRWSVKKMKELMPSHFTNEHEGFAELYRAILGADDCVNRFSDNQEFYASNDLSTLMKCMYWLNANVTSMYAAAFTIQGHFITWQEWSFFYWRYFAVDTNWVKYEWKNGAWGQA